MGTDAVSLGRAAFDRRQWGDAFASFLKADRQIPLDPDDLDRLAASAYMMGKVDEGVDFWTRAHHALLEQGEIARAVRCVFWLCFSFFSRGDMAQGGGWLARGQRILDDAALDCVERGYLLVPMAIGTAEGGESEAAYGIFVQIAEVAERFKDSELATFARLGFGRCLIRMGHEAEGGLWLDEVMIAITANEVNPIIAGDIYCSVIEGCNEMFDVRRAREWTNALHMWCESQPDLLPYRGQCLVHRAQLFHLQGAWPDAIEEARRAREFFLRMQGQTAIGEAFYEQAEIHRLRGEFEQAEEMYREADQHGRKPEPGFALLRLSHDQLAAADGMIRRAVDEAAELVHRTRLLPAFVEIMLAAGDIEAAEPAAAELAQHAETVGAPLLRALAAHAQGATLLMKGDARAALASLRTAWSTWRELEAPYDEARTRLLIGEACRRLGDNAGADVEIGAARASFASLGAAPDLARLDELAGKTTRGANGGLTGRELEILRLVAAGKTNRGIADELVISEKTVARHVSNIFTKLSLSSRSAATAYAYEHDLV